VWLALPVWLTLLALLAVLAVPVPLLPLPAAVPPPAALLVWAGVLEPHPLIRATMTIRASAASGRNVLFMRSPPGGHLR
jgi:hypothetical protein